MVGCGTPDGDGSVEDVGDRVPAGDEVGSDGAGLEVLGAALGGALDGVEASGEDGEVGASPVEGDAGAGGGGDEESGGGSDEEFGGGGGDESGGGGDDESAGGGEVGAGGGELGAGSEGEVGVGGEEVGTDEGEVGAAGDVEIGAAGSDGEKEEVGWSRLGKPPVSVLLLVP